MTGVPQARASDGYGHRMLTAEQAARAPAEAGDHRKAAAARTAAWQAEDEDGSSGEQQA